MNIDPKSCMEYWNTRSSESQFINVNGFEVDDTTKYIYILYNKYTQI